MIISLTFISKLHKKVSKWSFHLFKLEVYIFLSCYISAIRSSTQFCFNGSINTFSNRVNNPVSWWGFQYHFKKKKTVIKIFVIIFQPYLLLQICLFRWEFLVRRCISYFWKCSETRKSILNQYCHQKVMSMVWTWTGFGFMLILKRSQ